MEDMIGIGISKDKLDVFRLSDGLHTQVTDDATGHRDLLRWIGKQQPCWLYLRRSVRATAIWKFLLVLHLRLFVKVNPKQARRFAQAVGKLAKTHSLGRNPREPRSEDKISAAPLGRKREEGRAGGNHA